MDTNKVFFFPGIPKRGIVTIKRLKIDPSISEIYRLTKFFESGFFFGGREADTLEYWCV